MADTKRKRRLLIGGGLAGLVLLLIVGGVLGSGGWGEERGRPVEADEAVRRTLTQVVTASGKAQPEVEVEISPDVSGEIISLPVREGKVIQKGELLARIKPDVYEAQREQAEAGVLQAQANVQQAEADLMQAAQELERQKTLYDKNAISAQEYEAAQTRHEVARASRDAAKYRMASAKANLDQAQKQLGKTSIYAPMSGTISRLNVELGERVVGTSQMAGTEMMRVALLDQMEMEVEVNENDIVNVAEGDSARVEIDAYPDRTFRGVVTEIANSARVSNQGTQEQVTNFPVKVRIQDMFPGREAAADTAGANLAARQEAPALQRHVQLRPGMSGTVDISTETVFDAVSVPIQAVTVRDLNKYEKSDNDSAYVAKEEPKGEENLQKVVFIIEDGTARMRRVETGIADDQHIEITSGLAGGEMVITGPYRVVSRELEPGISVYREGDAEV